MAKLIKVDSVGHFDPKKSSRHAIYSIDFQPFGGRLATAGGDCTVKLWNTEAIMSQQSKESVSDSLLATLSSHSKSVNVVKWSPDSRFLASGSDDCLIIIYRYTPDAISSQTFGCSAARNKETWSRCFTLQGHIMDVLDICWSPRGILASASIDNKIMIWDMRRQMASMGVSGAHSSPLISPTRILDGHKSFVKGVSFDPIGTYLASSGGDNLIILWDCDSWTILHRLDGPFKDSPDRTMFRRLSWAPDGSSLCISAATKSSKPVGMVLKRESWTSIADLVGHNEPSLCCKFCPYVLCPYVPYVENMKGGDIPAKKKLKESGGGLVVFIIFFTYIACSCNQF